MNKITSLDFQYAVFTYPLSKQEKGASYRAYVVPFYSNEKVVSLFQNSPKVRLGPTLPRLLRKGHLSILKVFEALKAALEIKENSNLLDEIFPPRILDAPQLPFPPFRAAKPPRFFWRKELEFPKDIYAPPCLMAESGEDKPVSIANLSMAKKGVLRQDDEGYVYLELPEELAGEVFFLIRDKAVQDGFVHIPVVLPQEWDQKKGLGAIKELGSPLSFEVRGLYSLKARAWPGVEKVFFLRSPSQELETLREKYLLPSRIRGHDFHAVIALKPGNAPARRENFRLNVSCFAA